MRRSTLLLVVIALAACASSAEPRGGPAAHPEPQGTALERNAACESCHADIAAEWRSSLHMQSWSHPVYQRAFAVEPLEFCTRCHAPEADANASPREAASLGTACVTCHAGGETKTSARPCAECHEFSFPDGRGLMQLTATEHRASVQSSTPCATCHMPRVAGHTSHRFGASRDVAFQKRAADIRASRSPNEVVITLIPRDIGHALPTGDLFRRLRVDVGVVGDATTQRRVLLQRNTKTGGPDTRPFVNGASAEVRVPVSAPGRAIAWSVTYERVEQDIARDLSDAVIEGSNELASGTLAP